MKSLQLKVKPDFLAQLKSEAALAQMTLQDYCVEALRLIMNSKPVGKK